MCGIFALINNKNTFSQDNVDYSIYNLSGDIINYSVLRDFLKYPNDIKNLYPK